MLSILTVSQPHWIRVGKWITAYISIDIQSPIDPNRVFADEALELRIVVARPVVVEPSAIVFPRGVLHGVLLVRAHDLRLAVSAVAVGGGYTGVLLGGNEDAAEGVGKQGALALGCVSGDDFVDDEAGEVAGAAAVAQLGDGLAAVVEVVRGDAVDGALYSPAQGVVLEVGGEAGTLNMDEAAATIPGVLGNNSSGATAIRAGFSGEVATEVIGERTRSVGAILALAFEGELGEAVALVVLGFDGSLGNAADSGAPPNAVTFGVVLVVDGFQDAVAEWDVGAGCLD